MLTLSTLQNTHRPSKKTQRVGRGNGSKRGKTCGRGEKGDKSRSGYKRRFGKREVSFLYLENFLAEALRMVDLDRRYLV